MAYFDVSPFNPLVSIPAPTDHRDYARTRCLDMLADPIEVFGPKRYPRLVHTRRIIAGGLRRMGASLTEIGRALGGRHHTTILSLLRGGKGKR
jgi:hypothetical protein